MKNKELQKSVESYLESSDDQAFQIDGLWGTGKTYFVQNKLEDVFKHTKYIPLYVSLNGISNFNEINKILSRLAILSTNDTKNKYKTFSKIESTLDMIDTAGLAGVQAHSVIYLTRGFLKHQENNLQKKIKFEKFVLIFDELERVPNFKLLLNFLGQMSSLQNQWGCKSIVVSNEEKFCQLNDYLADIYLSVKEKFISRTWKFGNDSIDVAKTLIMESIQQGENPIVSDWVNKTIDRLLKIISPINIRIVKSILTTYNQFYREIISMKIDDKLREQSLKTGFLAIFSLTYMVKMGKLVSESSLNSIFNQSSQAIVVINSQTNGTKSLKTEKDKKNNEPLNFLTETFLNKFTEFDDNVIYSRQITNLVMHGYMDHNQFIQEIRDIFLPQSSKYQCLLSGLQNFRNLKENNLIMIEKETTNMLENSSLNYNQLTQFYTLIQFLDKRNLWLVKPLLNNLAKKIANKIKLSDITEADIELYMDIYSSKIRGADFNIIKSAVDSQKNTLVANHNNKTINYILKNDVYSAIKNNNNGFTKGSLFNQLVNRESGFLNKNTSLIGIDNFIINEILNVNNSYDFYSDVVPQLKKLKKALKDIMANTTDKVIKFNQEALLKTLNKAETKLNRTSNN